MDALGITGNDGAHPSEMRLDEEASDLVAVFAIVNVLVERLVSIPATIVRIYDARARLKEADRAARRFKGTTSCASD